MKRDMIKEIKTSFFSCEKDAELILKKLLVENRNASEDLKRLLLINTKDCLDKTNSKYQQIVNNTSVAELMEKNYITLVPRIRFAEHEEVKTYIIMGFDNFRTNATNPEFRNHTISFDILCHTDYWDIGNYQLRPLKIAGYIDGILNNTKLSGIGCFLFSSCNELIVNEDIAGYTLIYNVVNGNDDLIAPEE